MSDFRKILEMNINKGLIHKAFRASQPKSGTGRGGKLCISTGLLCRRRVLALRDAYGFCVCVASECRCVRKTPHEEAANAEPMHIPKKQDPRAPKALPKKEFGGGFQNRCRGVQKVL